MEASAKSILHDYSGLVYDSETALPMASVAVSNGREVVLTDEAGRYVLKGWHKASFITVTVPTNYWSSCYYIPVSDKESGYDFALDRLENDYTNHVFLQVTDSEVGAKGPGQWVEKLRRVAEKTHPAFIVHTGDICYIDGLKAHLRGMNSENMGVPVKYVIGNHDYVNWGEYGEALFESIYGPVMYSFEVGRIHYIITPIVHGDVKAKYTQSDVAAFLVNDLRHVSHDKKAIMFNHDFCAGDEAGFVFSDGRTKIDWKRHHLLAWVFGHWHYNYLNEIGGIFNITTSRPDTGGIDASPATVRSVVLEGGALKGSRCHYNDFEETAPTEAYQWNVSLGGNILYSAPALGDGIVFAGTVSDGWPKQCSVAAICQETGEILWKYQTKNSVKSDIRVIGHKVIAQDTEGNVYCFDFSGNLMWNTKTELRNPNNSASSIAANEDYVYCGGQQQVYCLRVSDGSQVWSKKLSGGNTSPSGFVLHENILFVGAHWDRLYALDAAMGETLWTNNSHKLNYFIMTPAVYGGCLFAASWSRLYKIEIGSGNTVKYREFEGYVFNSATTPYVEEAVMYMGTTNKGVVAVDTESLDILWTFETGKNLILTSPYSFDSGGTVDSAVVPMGKALCFGASDGFLYVIDKNGKKIEAHNIGSPVNQAPIAVNGSMIAADFSGNIVCIAVLQPQKFIFKPQHVA